MIDDLIGFTMLDEEKLHNLINSVKDCNYPDKPNKISRMKVHDSDNEDDKIDEDDENFQEEEDKRVYAKYLL